MKGGRYIASGQESCIFDDPENSRQVIQISKKNESKEAVLKRIENELMIGNELRKLDPEEMRFVTPTKYEVISRDEFEEMYPELFMFMMDCQADTDPVEKRPFKIPDWVVLAHMKRVTGVPEYGLTLEQKAYIKESVDLMQRGYDNNNTAVRKIAHNDLHEGNIMMSGLRPVIIDFGRSKLGPFRNEGYAFEDDQFDLERILSPESKIPTYIAPNGSPKSSPNRGSPGRVSSRTPGHSSLRSPLKNTTIRMNEMRIALDEEFQVPRLSRNLSLGGK
jgi:hypothetical protein